MLYAKVVVGLPVEGPFDYIVPQELRDKINSGTRVRIIFAHRKIIGFVVGLSKKTAVTKLNPILQILDDLPILDDNLLRLTKELSDYYCCSWGEAIETAIPPGLREGKALKITDSCRSEENRQNITATLLHEPDFKVRWQMYLERIKKVLDNNRSVIILLPDMRSLAVGEKLIRLKLGVSVRILNRKSKEGLSEWAAIKQLEAGVVMGVRSAIFAPIRDLGLIIIDEEENFVYKQDQSPHYNAGEIAFMRSRAQGADLILGSGSPSMEMIYLAKEGKIDYSRGVKKDIPEIRIVDIRAPGGFAGKKKAAFSKLLEDAVFSAINAKDKVLLFLNRKGFATSAACLSCGANIKCPRCSVNLVYYRKTETLECHFCNFKIPPPKICPACNAGYIKYSGTGAEKIESDLSVLFPSAVIKRVEAAGDLDLSSADIFVATSAIKNEAEVKFGLTGVLSIDNSLNHADFRSAENTFGILSDLLGLTEKKMIIQTAVPRHHLFAALLKNDPAIFYDEELKQRNELSLPPYRHLILVKLRGINEEKVKSAAEELFEKLAKAKKNKGTRILSLNPGTHPKLRDNFYRRILISADNVQDANKFLKFNLKKFSRSGIIVTVDVDPI